MPARIIGGNRIDRVEEKNFVSDLPTSLSSGASTTINVSVPSDEIWVFQYITDHNTGEDAANQGATTGEWKLSFGHAGFSASYLRYTLNYNESGAILRGYDGIQNGTLNIPTNYDTYIREKQYHDNNSTFTISVENNTDATLDFQQMFNKIEFNVVILDD